MTDVSVELKNSEVSEDSGKMSSGGSEAPLVRVDEA